MALDDIYQIKLEYHDVHGEEMSNVFYYVQTEAGTMTATNLRASFVTTVVAPLQAMWPAATIVDAIRTINGMDNSDYDSDFTNRVGTNGSTAYLPSFMAVGFRNPPPGPGQSYAYKRFGGVTDQLDSGDGDWDATFLTLAASVETVLKAVLQPGAIDMSPCIVTGGFRLGTAPTFARLCTSNWQVNDTPTTQNTRKGYNWN